MPFLLVLIKCITQISFLVEGRNSSWQLSALPTQDNWTNAGRFSEPLNGSIGDLTWF